MNKVLFTKKNCEKCAFVKENLPASHDINIVDIETPAGLSLLSWLSLTNTAQTKLPIYAEFNKKDQALMPEVINILIGAINIKNYISPANAQ
jgi:hypothetical protein